MSRVKHFKIVSSLPATLEPNSIYYVRVGTGFDLYTTTSSSPVIARPLNTSTGSGSGGKDFQYSIKLESNIGSGQWYDRYKDIHSGHWQGWNKKDSNPMILPYNCKIVKAHINFSKAKFDWRSSAGPIYLDIGFLDHNYNGTFNERILRFEIDGSFTGNDTGNSSFRYILTEDDISAMSGSNNFNEGEMIGCLTRASTYVAGRIYEIENPFHSLTFEEV